MTTFAFAYSPPDGPRKRKRQTWTDEENRIILSSVRRLGTQWDLVAAQLPGRTADAVRNQCHRLQKSSGAFGVMDDDCVSDVSSEDRKIGSAHGRSVWTAEEDRVICEGVRSLGCKWRKIAALLPGRSDSSVRNRWSRIGESADNQKAPFGEQPLPLPQEVPSERDALDMRAVPAHSAGMLPEHAYHVPVFTATVLYPHLPQQQPPPPPQQQQALALAPQPVLAQPSPMHQPQQAVQVFQMPSDARHVQPPQPAPQVEQPHSPQTPHSTPPKEAGAATQAESQAEAQTHSAAPAAPPPSPFCEHTRSPSLAPSPRLDAGAGASYAHGAPSALALPPPGMVPAIAPAAGPVLALPVLQPTPRQPRRTARQGPRQGAHGRARQPKHKYELAPTEDLPSELRHADLCPAPADLRGDLPQHEFDDLSYSDSPGPSSHAPPVEPLMTLFVSLEHDDEAYSAATASPSA